MKTALLLLVFTNTLFAQRAGDLDAAFGDGGKVTTNKEDDMIFSIGFQPDGKIIAAGLAETTCECPETEFSNSIFLARYNTTGRLDPTFGIEGIVSTDICFDLPSDFSMTLQYDGKIVIAGARHNKLIVVRYDVNGSEDKTFQKVLLEDTAYYYDEIFVMTRSDGKITIIESFYELSVYDDTDSIMQIRWAVDGTLESYHTAPLFEQFIISEAAIQPDDKIILAGFTNLGDSSHDFALMRFNPDGSRDESFGMPVTEGPGRDDWLLSLAVQADGKIVLAGELDDNVVLMRYNNDGTQDKGFGIDGIAKADDASAIYSVSALLIQPDGKIVIAGEADSSSEHYSSLDRQDFALVRYHADGSIDRSFGINGKVTTDFNDLDHVCAAALQADGKIVAAGFTYNNEGPVSGGALARYWGR